MDFTELSVCPACNTELRPVKPTPGAQWLVGYCDQCQAVPTRCLSCGRDSMVQPISPMDCPYCGEYREGSYLAPIFLTDKF